VSSTPLAPADSPQSLDDLLKRWSTPWFDSGVLVAIETTNGPDDRGHYRWLLRFRGDEKDYVTLWLSLRQRTLHVEVQVMPAPEDNVEDVYRYVLTKNADLYGLHVALGPESALYLVGRFAVGEVTADKLDGIVGAALSYVDEIFPTAMTMGLPALYRRRRRNA